MVLVVWVAGEEAPNRKILPRISTAHLIHMNDEMEEKDTMIISGEASASAGNEDVLQDWRKLFDAINGLSDDSGQKLLVFPNASHRTRFKHIDSVLQKAEGFEGCNATHHAALGELLVTNGEKVDIDVGVPRLKELLKQQGLKGLAEEGYIRKYGEKRPAREGILNCESYFFYGDRATKQYHLRTCAKLDEVGEGKLLGLGKDPGKQGWQSCPLCIKEIVIAPKKKADSVKMLAWEKRSEGIGARKIQNRAEIIKQEITAVCAEYGMHAGFVGGTAFITTVVGEWYFTYNDRPIRLYHKNYSKDAKQVDRSMNFYHLQDKRFASPVHVLRYISEHDLDLKRRVMQEADGEMAADRYYYGDTELDIVSRATIFATRVHGEEEKGEASTPYILHLMEAATIAASMTDDQEVITATVLHGIIDDAGVKPADIQLKFGARIYKLVMSASEKTRPDIKWGRVSKERKSAFVNYLFFDATQDERIITLSDKLSALRALRRRYKEEGDAIWEKAGRGKDFLARYYQGLRDALGRLQDTDAWKEFRTLVDEVFYDAIDVNDLESKAAENTEEQIMPTYSKERLFSKIKKIFRNIFSRR